ncbi:restriction endonuclease subunit S [uncultured Fusobacterium sp.]|jgi:type I restriction enzyme S subunit|uniref:restriction endonuclease subunit S n=1 Tax=uncultured Fusobacterium sp. TaxID=159267 RepID=UPI00265E5AD9|nr:restriction endonuclease subunit S [uncultured Fusobacterium sp.]
MSSYKKIPLGEVASYINGYAFKPIDWGKSGLPIIRIQNLTDENKEFNYYEGNFDKKYLIKRGDILISWSASLGIYEWNKSDAILNQHIFKVIFDKIQVDKKYYFFVLKKILREAIKNTHGSTMKHITRPQFEKILFPFYELEKQKKIAKILENISNIIEKKKQKLQEYDELSKSIFIEMFGDLSINNKNFEMKKIKEIAEIFIGVTYQPQDVVDLEEKGIVVLRSGNIQNFMLDFKDRLKIKKDIREKFFVRSKDILMCSRNGSSNLVGKVAIIDNLTEKMTFGAFMTIIRSEYYTYLYNYFKSSYFKKSKIFRKTTTINQITKIELKNLIIPIPNIELQNQFAERIKIIEKSKFLLLNFLKV